MSSDAAFGRQIARFPKSELHVHLRGAMSIGIFTELLNKYASQEPWRHASKAERRLFERFENIRPFLVPREWSAEAARPLFHYESFDQFIATWCFTGYFVREKSDLRMIIRGVLQSLKEQHIVYAEITTSPTEYLRQGITLPEIIECVEEAKGFPGIEVQWIVDPVRDNGADAARWLIERIMEIGSDSVVGLTLGGSEYLFPPALFVDVYHFARDHGLRLSIHAGEVLGPESIWDAINILGAERIGHGVRAVEDPSLVAHLAEHRIPLEVCPTSNLRIGICDSYQDHPARELFLAGIPITINSDDPTFFDTTLMDEFVHLRSAGFEDQDIRSILRSGFIHSFLPKDRISEYLDDLDREWKESGI